MEIWLSTTAQRELRCKLPTHGIRAEFSANFDSFISTVGNISAYLVP